MLVLGLVVDKPQTIAQLLVAHMSFLTLQLLDLSSPARKTQKINVGWVFCFCGFPERILHLQSAADNAQKVVLSVSDLFCQWAKEGLKGR